MYQKRIVITLCAMMIAISGLFLWHQPCAAQTDDLLDTTLKGCRNAVESIKTYKGSLTMHYWRRYADDKISERVSKYLIAYDNGKYRFDKVSKAIKNNQSENIEKALSDKSFELSVNGNSMETVAFDGKKFRHKTPDMTYAQVYGAADKRYIDMIEQISIIGHGLFKIEAGKQGQLSVIGKEKLDGDECIIIENRFERTLPVGGISVTTYEYWVSPGKGYTVPKVRLWAQTAGMENRILFQDIISEIKNYGNGIWGPSKSTMTQYIQTGTNKGEKSMQTTLTYNQDFKINVPISPEEITLQ